MANREKPLHLVLFQSPSGGSQASRGSNPVANPEPLGVAGKSAYEPVDESLLQVGELAKASGKTVRAIHLYEELGLLRTHERSKGRYRLFTEEAVVRVRWITKLQGLGLSLSEIQELVKQQEELGSAQFAATHLGQIYRAKLLETRTKITELRALEAELEDSLSYLATCGTACEPELPVHSCPTCERHPERTNPPDLVAGVHLSRVQVS